MALPLVAAAIIAWTIVRAYQYFLPSLPLDNLPGPPHVSFLHGNWLHIVQPQNWAYFQHIAETYGPVAQFSGPLGMRIVHIFDPKAMYNVLIKDIDQFPKSMVPVDEFHILLGPGLLTTEGEQHRRQRKLLNPVFSAAHLRNMTHIFYDIAHRLRNAVKERVKEDAAVIDVNGWMARTTLEMLGQAGLGYSFDNFVQNSTDAYGQSLKNFFPMYSRMPLLGFIVPWLSMVTPEWLLRRLLWAYPLPNLRSLLNISQKMESRSMEIIHEKKCALNKSDEELVHRIGEGKDIMSILLKANTAASESEKLSDDELVAQMSIFALAGMDTTSNAVSRSLHLLAQHPNVQDKLRAEILEAQGGLGLNVNEANIGYDDLVKLPYLDAVCRETLRLYPPVNFITRRAAKDTLIPLSEPVKGKDGRLMNEVAVSRRTLVMMNLQLSNCNKALWGDDAYEWRPDRWLEPLPSVLEEARIPGVYSNLMSFSGGSRSCIGLKFSQLEMKVVLAVLLSSLSFEVTDTPIVWNWGPVSYPTMGEKSDNPEMLLRVKSTPTTT